MVIYRVGCIFTPGTDGLQTSGKERPMVKVVFIQKPVMYFLAISKMVGDMATSFASMLMEQGLCFPMTYFLPSSTTKQGSPLPLQMFHSY